MPRCGRWSGAGAAAGRRRGLAWGATPWGRDSFELEAVLEVSRLPAAYLNESVGRRLPEGCWSPVCAWDKRPPAMWRSYIFTFTYRSDTCAHRRSRRLMSSLPTESSLSLEFREGAPTLRHKVGGLPFNMISWSIGDHCERGRKAREAPPICFPDLELGGRRGGHGLCSGTNLRRRLSVQRMLRECSCPCHSSKGCDGQK